MVVDCDLPDEEGVALVGMDVARSKTYYIILKLANCTGPVKMRAYQQVTVYRVDFKWWAACNQEIE
jgi:hypothetical protein